MTCYERQLWKLFRLYLGVPELIVSLAEPTDHERNIKRHKDQRQRTLCQGNPQTTTGSPPVSAQETGAAFQDETWLLMAPRGLGRPNSEALPPNQPARHRRHRNTFSINPAPAKHAQPPSTRRPRDEAEPQTSPLHLHLPQLHPQGFTREVSKMPPPVPRQPLRRGRGFSPAVITKDVGGRGSAEAFQNGDSPPGKRKVESLGIWAVPTVPRKKRALHSIVCEMEQPKAKAEKTSGGREIVDKETFVKIPSPDEKRSANAKTRVGERPRPHATQTIEQPTRP